MTEHGAIEVLKTPNRFDAELFQVAYEQAIQALEKVEIARGYLEPLRNFDTHNEHVENLKELFNNF